MKRRVAIMTICALLGVASQVSATLIVVVFGRTRVMVGADSLRQRDRGALRPEQACKIHAIGDGHYAVASGLVGSGKTFDLWEIISSASKGGGLLSEKAARLDAMLVGAFKETLRGDALALTRRIDVLFLAVDHSTPEAVYRRYIPSRDLLLGEFTIEVRRQSDLAVPGTVIFLGSGAEAMQGLDPRTSLGPVGTIENAMVLAIERRPGRVGLPINIIEVTADGGQWVERGDSCPEDALETKLRDNPPTAISAPAK